MIFLKKIATSNNKIRQILISQKLVFEKNQLPQVDAKATQVDASVSDLKTAQIIYSLKQQRLVVWCFIFAELTKSFFSSPWIKNQSRDLVKDLTTLSQELEIPGGVYPQHPLARPFWYGYYIRKKFYARKAHNSFTVKVSCETYRQTMNNFKLKTKYGSIH